MSKPLAGRRLFEAWGQSDATRGVSLRNSVRPTLPEWARIAKARGHFIGWLANRSHA